MAATTGVSAVDEAAAIHRELTAAATPQRAKSERAYLKSSLDHLGTSVPDTRSVVKRWLRLHPALTHDELIELCDELWSQPVHERRMAAVDYRSR